MDKLTREINRKFNNKYLYLKLLEINYNPQSLECEIVFLYPHTFFDVPEGERRELKKFLTEYLKLNAETKLRFKKSFLDEYLVRKRIMEFLSANQKSVASYIIETDITSTFDNLELKIQISLAGEIKKYFEEKDIKTSLLDFLNSHFLAHIELDLVTDPNKTISTEISRQPVIISKPKTERYKVNIIKKVIGGEILPQPELIKNIKGQKQSCILGGIIEDVKRGEFKPKKPKTEDETRYYYTFTINDDTAKISVTYFASKTGAKQMDTLEAGMFVLINGDVRKGMGDKLTLYVKRLSLANKIIEEQKTEAIEELLPDEYITVFPEALSSLEQENLFDKKIYKPLIHENTFVVFDVETTGLDAEVCEIVELSAVKVRNGRILEKFDTLVKPTKEIPEETIRIHGITNQMVASSSKIEPVILDFYRFAKGCVLSGYNVGFDMKFIQKAAEKVGLSFDNKVVDVMAVVRTSGIKSKNLKLTTVAKVLEVNLENAHRAFHDAYATAEVLLKLHEERA